jgi:biopolymer transport protein TolR
VAVNIRNKRQLMGEINVVPYIDVMLVLLIIFMVTAPLLTQGIEVELPKVGGEPVTPPPGEDQQLIVTVDREGNFFVNFGDDQDQPASDEHITEVVQAVLSRNPSKQVLVKGDARAAYGDVARAMVVLQGAGAVQIGMITDPEELASRGGT